MNTDQSAEPALHETWSTNRAFLFASIGCAVGLGNVWRFPYITGINGGGAFIFIYLLCIVLFVAPLLMAELTLGRLGRKSAVTTMRDLIKSGNLSRGWMSIGWLALIIPALGLSYYSIVAGWSLAYMVMAIRGLFEGMTGPQSAAAFDGLSGAPVSTLFWHGVFMATTTFIVARGLHGGLEKAVRLLMPALFTSLILLVIYAAVTADFVGGLKFMFTVDFTKVTGETVLMAVGQAFFSVAVGVGAMITYGAYLPSSISIPRAAGIIAGADTLVAILAGLAIFPILFAAGLDAGQGPKLLFVTMPIAFGSMPGGVIFGALFFFLIATAGLTSTIGMLEPIISWLEEKPGFTRPVVTMICGVVIWAAGIGAALSYSLLSGFYPLDFITLFQEKTIFDVTDYIVANVLIPLSGFLIALFVGWRIAAPRVAKELSLDGKRFKIWQFLVRFVAPIALIAIFIANAFG